MTRKKITCPYCEREAVEVEYQDGTTGSFCESCNAAFVTVEQDENNRSILLDAISELMKDRYADV